MDALWEVIRSWNPWAQGIFLFSVIFLVLALIEELGNYVAVMVRGWPEPFTQRGEMTVNTGQHEISVRTASEPSRVWVSFDEEDTGIAVCQGGVDRAAVTINKNGFVLNLDIQSSARKLRWRAEF